MGKANDAQQRQTTALPKASASASGERPARRSTESRIAAQNAPTVKLPKVRPPELEENEIAESDDERPTPIYPRFALSTYVSLPEETEVESPGRYSAQDIAPEKLGAAPTRPPKRGAKARASRAR